MTTPTVSLAPLAKQRFVDNNGNPLAGGKLFTYAAGTTTKQNTYTDSSGATPNPNPVILDARGESEVWLDASLIYKFVISPSTDSDPPTNPFWTVDEVSVPGQSYSKPNGAAQIGLQTTANAQVTTLLDFLSREVWIDDYLDAAGKADVRAHTESIACDDALDQALTDAAAKFAPIRGNGFYRLQRAHMINFDACYFIGSGPRGAVFRCWEDIADPYLDFANASAPGTQFLNAAGLFAWSLRAMVPTTQGCLVRLNKVQQVMWANVQLEDHYIGLIVLGGVDHYTVNLHIFSPRDSGGAAWTGVKVGSRLIKIDQAADGIAPSEIFYVNVNCRRSGNSAFVEVGIEINCADGVWATAFHTLGVSTDGVLVNPSRGTEQISGLGFDLGWFDNYCNNNFRVTGQTTGTYGAIRLTGCKFFNAANHAIFDDNSNCEGFIVTGGEAGRSGAAGVFLSGGKLHSFGGVFRIAACNTSAAANSGAFVVDPGTGSGPTIGVDIGDISIEQTTQTITATAMIGLVVNAGVTAKITCKARFNLTAVDIQDLSGNLFNDYRGSRTTKAAAIGGVVSSVLQLPEIGDVFLVPASTNFNAIATLRDGRIVTLVYQGVCTVTHNTGSGGVYITGHPTSRTTAANDAQVILGIGSQSRCREIQYAVA